MAELRTDSLDLDPKKSFDSITWRNEYQEQDFESFTNRYKTDAMANKIVSKPAEDAMRNGFRLVIPKNEDLQNTYQQALDALQPQKEITKQIKFNNTHGDGYLAINVVVDGKNYPYTPIDIENLRSIQSIHAFGNTHVTGYNTNDNPTSSDYMKESSLIIKTQNAGTTVSPDGDVENKPAPSKNIVLDRSRYGHMTRDKFEGDIFGTSLIKKCEKELNTMKIAVQSVGKILREYTFKIVKSDDIMSKDDADFAKAVDQIGYSLNTEDTAFIGSEDDIAKVSTPTAGLSTLLDFAWQSLAATSGIPKSVLTGEQAGTLAGASQDVINYYDGIKAMQEQDIKPELVKIVRLLMWSKDVGGGRLDPDSLDWHIEFNPLWTPDGKTQAETEYTKAQTLGLYVDKGIYGYDEARHIVEGQANGELQGVQKVSADSGEDVEQYLDKIEKEANKEAKDNEQT